MLQLKRKKKKNWNGPKVSGIKKRRTASRTTTRRKRGFALPFISKKSTSKRSRRRKPTLLINAFRLVTLLLVSTLTLYLLYSGLMWVIGLRASKTVEETVAGNVIGFDDVPIYPDSRYIFSQLENPDQVQEFLASGRSIYRLDRTSTIHDVFQFYQKELPQLGWEHILSVSRTSKEQMYGEYWVNRKENIALRIYDRVNDIWFEKLSIKQAESGLSQLVQQETERELLLSSTEGTELLPDFPWTLNVPREFIAGYYATDVGDYRGVKFTAVGGDEEYFLEPVAPIREQSDDGVAEIYVTSLNLKEGDDSDKNNWEILNSQYQAVGGREYLVVDLVNKNKNGRLWVLHNSRIGYKYVLFQPHEENSFSNYLLKNIEDKNRDFTGEEFQFSGD